MQWSLWVQFFRSWAPVLLSTMAITVASLSTETLSLSGGITGGELLIEGSTSITLAGDSGAAGQLTMAASSCDLTHPDQIVLGVPAGGSPLAQLTIANDDDVNGEISLTADTISLTADTISLAADDVLLQGNHLGSALIGIVAASGETITGAVGTTETTFTSSTITIPTGWFEDPGDGAEIFAFFDCVGDTGDATNFIARVYWGGKASGVQLNPTVTLGVVTTGELVVRAHLTYQEIDASPIWHGEAAQYTSTNTSYIGSKQHWALTTQPPTATIALEASLQFSGGTPAAGDAVTLRKLEVRKRKGALQ